MYDGVGNGVRKTVRDDWRSRSGLDMEKDINETLQLNGELNSDGSVKHDTTSRLVASRKRIYDSAASQLAILPR